MNKSLSLSERAAVMPLPGVSLFPNALLPLYIFEPRYRAMLEHALARDRMFCVALIKPPRGDWKSAHDFFPPLHRLDPRVRQRGGRHVESNVDQFPASGEKVDCNIAESIAPLRSGTRLR